MLFECGGGDVMTNQAIMLTSPLLNTTEAYIMKQAPIAASMGQIVANGKPMVWLTGQFPFHVTDPSKLTIICPMRYRRYADQLNENVPIFIEDVSFGNTTTAGTTLA